MKILVPLNNRIHLADYVCAGADEFYLGFYDDRWFDRFGKYADINRMSGFGKNANSYSFSEAMDILSDIKSRNKAAFLTLNANAYSKEERDYILHEYFPAIKASGADGIIVSDQYLGSMAVQYGLGAVASTMCAIYNSDIAHEFFKAGIRRQIIPRDVSLDEIAQMCSSNKEIEYEVFLMRNGCVFSDSFCLGLHRPECGSTCGYIKSQKKEIISAYSGFRERHDIELNDYLYNAVFHRDACGQCALYRLKKAGVSSLKIVGRADLHEEVEKDILLTRKNLGILENCLTEEEYLNSMIIPEGFMQKCQLGFSCYYPEVRF